MHTCTSGQIESQIKLSALQFRRWLIHQRRLGWDTAEPVAFWPSLRNPQAADCYKIHHFLVSTSHTGTNRM